MQNDSSVTKQFERKKDEAIARVTRAIEGRKIEPWRKQRLNLAIHKLRLISSFDNLQVFETRQCQIRIMPHQVGAAFRVMNEMGHRAILADEVGLGKTIEAGILIKEYLCRKLINRVLILAPKSLLFQWQNEMLDKFGIKFTLDRDEDFSYDKNSLVIGTLEKARRDEYQPLIHKHTWDLVLIDEAHNKLSNPQNITYKFVDKIKKKYFLLLTATPLQKSLRDLWSLADLVNPGILGTRREFKERFVEDPKWEKLKNPEQLGGILRKVIIRTRRSEAGVHFVDRIVESCKINGEAGEYEIQNAVLDWVQNEYSQPGDDRQEGALQKILLLREIASSIQAALSTLQNKRDEETRPAALSRLRELITRLEKAAERTELHSKVKEVLKIYKDTGQEKLLVFVQYKATQKYLVDKLVKEGLKAKSFKGEPRERDTLLKWFKKDGQVLVCCDKTGSEGLNLQDACHIVVNYDLPWNPMAIEQRIGRVHRIGQEKKVQVFNLTLKNTIEDKILEILSRRVNLFRLAIGDTGRILGMNQLDGPKVEKIIAETLVNQKTREGMKDGLESMAAEYFKKDADKFQVQLNSFDKGVLENFHLDAYSLKYSEGDNDA